MAEQFRTRQNQHELAISPYASVSHNRGIGRGYMSLRKPTALVIAPLLLVGACTAVALAISGSSNPNSSNVKTDSTPVTSTQPVAAEPVPVTNNQPAQETAGNSSSMSVSSNVSNHSGANTQVTVNGAPVDVPANGSVQRTVTNPDGSTTSYSVNTSTQGTASNSNSTSTNLSVSSSSSSYNNNGGSAGGTAVINGRLYSY